MTIHIPYLVNLISGKHRIGHDLSRNVRSGSGADFYFFLFFNLNHFFESFIRQVNLYLRVLLVPNFSLLPPIRNRQIYINLSRFC